ncbi:MAG: hypothetical protein ACXWC0_14630 [Burkholderiales bacterium]
MAEALLFFIDCCTFICLIRERREQLVRYDVDVAGAALTGMGLA